MTAARITHLRLAVVLACAAALTVPTLARAATYQAKREGFQITLRVRGHYIVDTTVRYRLRCKSNPSRAFVNDVHIPRNLRIRRDGRFVYRQTFRSPPPSRTRLIGRVGDRGIIFGRFLDQADYTDVSGNFCTSGTEA